MDRENYDISTCRLKAECSASELTIRKVQYKGCHLFPTSDNSTKSDGTDVRCCIAILTNEQGVLSEHPQTTDLK